MKTDGWFKSVFDSSPDPTWIINEQNLFVACNLAAAETLGYKNASELVSVHPSQLSPEFQPDGQSSKDKANAMMAIAHNKCIHRFEWEHQRLNGECFPVEVTLSNLNGSGKQQLYCIWRDISSRKQAQEDLLLKTQVFEQSISANSTANTAGVITHVNQAFLNLWGAVDENEVIGKPITYFLCYENEALAIIQALDKTGRWEGEYTGLRKDRSKFIAQALATTILDDSGHVIGYQSSVIDISHRKQREKENTKLLSELGERVKEMKVLYGISESIHKRTQLVDIFEDAVKLIPRGWQYPKFAQCVIHFEKDKYQSGTAAETGDKIKQNIVVNDVISGFVGVFYTKKIPELGEEAFLKEEKELIRAVAKLLSQAIEHHRTEMDLRLQSEIALNIDEGISLVRATDGILVYVNENYEKMYGYEPGEMIGEHVSIVNAPSGKSPQELVLQVIQSLSSAGHWQGEFESVRKDGSVFWIHASVSMFAHSDYGDVFLTAQRDISENKVMEESLRQLSKQHERLSYLDGLTGIANRRLFDTTLRREWGRSAREKKPISLVIFDIDFFKQYNDLYGHVKGDDCLKSVAQELSKSSKRTVDLCARYGGEEFVLVLPDTDHEGALLLAEACRENVKSLNIPHLASSASSVVTISAGVATIEPASGSACLLLIEAADKALYQAKVSGRNRVCS